MGLWHADVCHGPALRVGNKSTPLRIPALLDDAAGEGALTRPDRPSPPDTLVDVDVERE